MVQPGSYPDASRKADLGHMGLFRYVQLEQVPLGSIVFNKQYRLLDRLGILYLCMVDGKYFARIWLEPTAGYWRCGEQNNATSDANNADAVERS